MPQRPLRSYEELRANAGLVITTEAMVAETPKRAAAGGDQGHGYGDGDGGGDGGGGGGVAVGGMDM